LTTVICATVAQLAAETVEWLVEKMDSDASVACSLTTDTDIGRS